MSALSPIARLLPSLLLPLVLLACNDEAVETDAPVFTDGDEAELELAEELALSALNAADGPIAQKGVQDVKVIKRQVDDLSMAHVKVQQAIAGVPVWGGEAIVHLQANGEVFALTDALIGGLNLDVRPDYDADEALDIAAALALPWEAQTAEPRADLWVLPAIDGENNLAEPHLVWRVQQMRTEGVDDPTMPVLFIDAHDGSLVWSYENLQTASCSGATNFYGTVNFDCYTDGTSFFTEDQADTLGVFSYGNTTSSLYYVSSTTTSFPTDQLTKNAVEAMYVANQTHDYYVNVHGRNGIDGAGGPVDVTAHGVGYLSSFTSYSRNYVNAFWDGTSMTYGDGDGVNSRSLTVLDVGGHEFTHGVTQYEANLTYSGEPGHLNEAYSDVFGAMVERYSAGHSANTWLIGEATWTPSVSGDALRYMADPARDGVSRDYWTSGIGSVDVHYGSGVPNLAFYLLSEGGTHPRGKSTVAVTGIGADDAAAIWYSALANYMTSSTNFAAARTAQINAATAIFGAGSPEVDGVMNSWAAVGVGAAAGGGGGTTPTCTSTSYSGSITRAGRSAYAPGSSGLSAGTNPMTVSMTGPSSANFNLYLEAKIGRTWTVVGSSTASGSTESLSYTGSTGTYRVRVTSATGTGSYAISWCK